jgi:hypothetical protein
MVEFELVASRLQLERVHILSYLLGAYMTMSVIGQTMTVYMAQYDSFPTFIFNPLFYGLPMAIHFLYRRFGDKNNSDFYTTPDLEWITKGLFAIFVFFFYTTINGLMRDQEISSETLDGLRVSISLLVLVPAIHMLKNNPVLCYFWVNVSSIVLVLFSLAQHFKFAIGLNLGIPLLYTKSSNFWWSNSSIWGPFSFSGENSLGFASLILLMSMAYIFKNYEGFLRALLLFNALMLIVVLALSSAKTAFYLSIFFLLAKVVSHSYFFKGRFVSKFVHFGLVSISLGFFAFITRLFTFDFGDSDTLNYRFTQIAQVFSAATTPDLVLGSGYLGSERLDKENSFSINFLFAAERFAIDNQYFTMLLDGGIIAIVALAWRLTYLIRQASIKRYLTPNMFFFLVILSIYFVNFDVLNDYLIFGLLSLGVASSFSVKNTSKKVK